MGFPVVGIDLDGVIVDFNAVALPTLAKYTGIGYSGDEIIDYDYYNCLPGVTKEIMEEAFKEFVHTPGFWRNLPSMSDEAIRAARSLSMYSILYAITARREMELLHPITWWDSTEHQSLLWLRDNNIHVMGVIRCNRSDEKGKLVRALGCEYFLDDNIQAFLSCAEEGVNAYLLDAPYNQGIFTDKRVFSLWDFVDIVRREVKS